LAELNFGPRCNPYYVKTACNLVTA